MKEVLEGFEGRRVHARCSVRADGADLLKKASVDGAS